MKIVIIVLLALTTLNLYGSSSVMYGADRLFLEINNSSETLVNFPSPPIGMKCQPERNLDIRPLSEETVSGLSSQSLTRKMIKKEINSRGRGMAFRYFLLVSPVKRKGKTHCSFILKNEDIVYVSFDLKRDIFRPVIPFKNEFSSDGEVKNSTSLERQYQIMKSLYKLGKPTGFAETTSREIKELKLERTSASYSFRYIGTDGVRFDVWRMKFTAKRDFTPRVWKKIKPNSVYLTAWTGIDRKSRSAFKRGEKGFLLLLKNKSTPNKYILNILP